MNHSITLKATWKVVSRQVIPGLLVSLSLAACGENITTYTSSGKLSVRENLAARAAVKDAASQLRLRLDREGLSDSWQSYDRGALSICTAGMQEGLTSIIIEPDSLHKKDDFNQAMDLLNRRLMRIDPKFKIETDWAPNPWM